MKHMIRCFGGLALLAGLSGCVTFDNASETVSQREDINILREDLNRVKGQMETVTLENQRMVNDIEKLRNKVNNNKDSVELQNRLDTLERQIHAVNAAREKDKQTIVDQLSVTIAELMRKAAARSAAASGNEHIVKRGETLSTIAAAYKVNINAIIEANGLADPDHLRAGQKLTIPR